MMTQMTDPRHFDEQTRRIRSQVSAVLTKWGLAPRFKRWRLAQDPDTGMIVLFGILNNSYIARHTSIPFGNYFDPRLLRDLANELQLQVVSCNSDGLRYAFVLDRGQLEELPTHIDYPYVDNGKIMVRVVLNEPLQPALVPQVVKGVDDAATPGDHRFVRQVASAFLKIFDDIKLRDDAALLLSAQDPPDIMIIDDVEFNKRVAAHEINRQKVKQIKNMFDESVG